MQLSTKIRQFTRLHLGIKLNIQSYRQIIVAVICYFLKEEIDKETLTLKADPKVSNFNKVTSKQINHSLRTKELSYSRSVTIFQNIKGSLQVQYLKFCFSYFSYFSIFDLDVIEEVNKRSKSLNTTVLSRRDHSI